MANKVSNQANAKASHDITLPNRAWTSIIRPVVAANIFELKLALIQMAQQDQFGGNSTEDPNAHLANFLEICDTIKLFGVSEDPIKLRLYLFSLRYKAKIWLNFKPANIFATWNDLSTAFLTKYFAPNKLPSLGMIQLPFVISLVNLYIRHWKVREPTNEVSSPWSSRVISSVTFYNGLISPTRITIDAAVCGVLIDKSIENAYEFLEEMASSSYQWTTNRGNSKRLANIYEIDVLNMLNARVNNIVNLLGK